MMYPNCQIDKENYEQTPLMLWIVHRFDPIPEELKYPGWEMDEDIYNQTSIMMWEDER